MQEKLQTAGQSFTEHFQYMKSVLLHVLMHLLLTATRGSSAVISDFRGKKTKDSN